jgi:Tfp pilus assembly protein PilP
MAFGVAVVGVVGIAFAASEDGALSGATAAIAKARAAAQKADARAAKTDGESARAAGEAPAEPKTSAEPAAPAPAEHSDSAAAETDTDTDNVPANRKPYDAAAHRDPFAPPRLTAAVADARTPLQTYQLGQLKLVGVVAESSAGGYRAMVEDSAGLGYIITTGTPIGSSGGVVRSIEPRRVVIEESARDFYGDMKPKEVVMELPQEDRSP